MPTFTLRTIEAVRGIQEFDELVVDGVRPLKALRNRIRDNPALMAELRTIFMLMDQVAKGMSLPKQKFHPLRNPTRNIDEYEFKSHHLRVYCFKRPNGKTIVWAGDKNNQDNDINRFRTLKDAYLDSSGQ